VPFVWGGIGGLGRSDQLRLYGVFEHLCLLALVAGFARRSLQLIQCTGDISVVLEAAVAIVLPGLIQWSVSSGTALGRPNGLDQLAFAHGARALDSKGACQLLQLGQDHGV
jgi:hypothetical protein